MRNQKGFTLLEVLISLALLGVIAAGILGALGTSSKATLTNDVQTTAQNLAEGQMEYVQNQPYDFEDPPEYALISGLPTDYSVSCTVILMDPEGDGSDDDDGLQKIVVAVDFGGVTAATIEAYKVR
ncbi:MAG: prepilin-type N-terminal cleavage/methylation domain-containing protein [Dehalococcoidales bacterium]|nr:MAG: prepilin-type N-terminal cleavage/methylation domain-containing protein [Dehalococcoidales bacterium]